MSVGHRTVERHGQEVTMRKYAYGAENEYGDATRNLDTEKTIMARADIGRQGHVERGPDGEEHHVDADLYIKDVHDPDDTVPVTEFVVNGHTYKTLIADDQDSGIIRVRCRRDD